MKEYNGCELLNHEEMTDYTYKFWADFGAFQNDERFDEEIKAEIWENLNTEDGIEKELDYVRQEFDCGWAEDSQEYKDLEQLWNYLNWYKTDFHKRHDAKSQLKAVKDHLLKHGSITSWDAITLYGATRLSAIIYILRHDFGYVIETQEETAKNRYGHKSKYARYILKEVGNDSTN